MASFDKGRIAGEISGALHAAKTLIAAKAELMIANRFVMVPGSQHATMPSSGRDIRFVEVKFPLSS